MLCKAYATSIHDAWPATVTNGSVFEPIIEFSVLTHFIDHDQTTPRSKCNEAVIVQIHAHDGLSSIRGKIINAIKAAGQEYGYPLDNWDIICVEFFRGMGVA